MTWKNKICLIGQRGEIAPLCPTYEEIGQILAIAEGTVKSRDRSFSRRGN